MSREESWKLLNKYMKSGSLIKHSLCVEVAMRKYAINFNEDEDKWGVCGLLHDFDYEMFPDNHPYEGNKILKSEGYPADIMDAIMGHSRNTNVERKTRMAKALFAVDELCGFIMACAYVRPNNLEGLKPKSVKKNLRSKRFAASVSREDIEEGIIELGVDKDEHIDMVIGAMQSISKDPH